MTTVAPMTSGDLDQIVDVHLESFDGYMNTMLGPRYLKAFYRWFVQNEEAIHYKAESEGRLVGFVVGAPTGYGKALTRAILPTAVGAIVTHPRILLHHRFKRAVGARVRVMLSRKKPEKRLRSVRLGRDGSGVSLVGIGVCPAAQGRGVGGRLMRAFEQEAVNRGFGYERLTVYGTNTAARRLYEREGWAVTGEREGVVTYTKLLGNSLQSNTPSG